jgi:hypothetical protein
MNRLSAYGLAAVVTACAVGAVLIYSPGIITPTGNDGRTVPVPVAVVVLEPKREAHSKQWFLDHPAQLTARLAECANNPSFISDCSEAASASLHQFNAQLDARIAAGNKP